MGFFSSSKSEPRAPDIGSGGMANVIRSRFYGKGKERERAAFNDLGNGTLLQDHEHSTPSGRNTANRSFGRASGRKIKASVSGTSSRPTTSSGNTPSISHLAPVPRPHTQPSPSKSSRTSADTITMTLAQRLGELATANEQGLLDDDEYRLLRANLFERLTNVSTVPSEAPIVRLSVSAHQNSRIPSPSPHTSRPSSVSSKASIISTFSGLLRRVTSRRFHSSPGSQPPTSLDSMIPSSASSPAQNRTFPREFLRGAASDSSIGSEVSAHRTSEYQRGGTPTSRKSSRHPPPSSYPNRGFKSAPQTPTRDQKHRPSDEIDLNEEHTQSVKELRAEIEAVEAEGRRLLDAFNGLELSTLTKRQRRPIPIQVSETDEGSIRSGRSASIHRPRQTPVNPGSQPLVSQPITLSRKNSLSSMSSRARSISGSHPPLPSTSSNSLGKYGASVGSTPSVNNVGFPTLETVNEATDPALAMLESEMADIRRRRAEVVTRYEAKLELLRAKLKGAEIHEKLLKR